MPIHIQRPVRRELPLRPRHSDYREDLRQDFNNACGYCDDSDLRIDRISFHVDHFAPIKRFPHLHNVYSNLVYSCRFCNMSKSDHWVGDDEKISHNGTEGFIDPCSVDYEQHLTRNASGRILGVSDLGRNIVIKLKLNLLRHELLWKARRARALRDEVESLLPLLKATGHPKTELYISLLERFIDLTRKIEDYELGANN